MHLKSYLRAVRAYGRSATKNNIMTEIVICLSRALSTRFLSCWWERAYQ